MIFCDYRAGSHELVAPLQALGLPVEETTLEFGDVMFEGRGEKGKPVSIGIEFKKLGELVTSLRTQRLQGYQLKGMRNLYDFSYLFIEGELLYGTDGGLLRRKGRKGSFAPLAGAMSIGELLKRLYVLHLRGGLNPIHHVCRRDTLQALHALYRTWTDTNLDAHKSHLGIYNAPSLVPISDFRRAVYAWPGIGMRGSLAVEKQFGRSIRKAANASVETWAAIQTIDDKGKARKIGMKVASQIIDFLNGQ